MGARKRNLEWEETNIVRLLVNRAKHRALEKNLPFDLDAEDLTVPELCPILGTRIVVARGKGKRDNSPSIDRIKPSLGYIKGNVWIISDLANKMKNNATPEQLKKFGEWAIKQQENDAS